MEEEKGKKYPILNILAVIAILTAAFLSQEPYFKENGKKFYSQINGQITDYWKKAEKWLKTNIYPKVISEAEKRGGEITKEINNQKNNIAQIIWEKLKNYFAEKFYEFFKIKVE
jgi:hypothetical protein